jgi:poly(3-hydroxybutyrate) depolymerase
VLYVVENGGHNWPGHPFGGFEGQFGHTTTDIDATTLMLESLLGPGR